ncbi:hypothetical protein DEO72_LG8g1877 [Vigna unguiculata]|uniref:Uncharacterized protein n=1 Tax=Vigna unguiculata TaxID=3917 RepID=A0A4D6MRZ5_VIGUN|nr:hypothetical protein DEO72_LG8g1877 [Vigna unguiculata]
MAQAGDVGSGQRVISPKLEGRAQREFVECHCNELAQAREPNLSKTGLITCAKASSLSEINAVLDVLLVHIDADLD